MSTYLKSSRRGVLASAFLLAIAMAFCLAFAAPDAAQAEEADLQVGAMQTQDAPDAIDYTDNDYKIVKEDMVSSFGMLSPVSNFQISYNSETEKITVSYTPSNKTIYAAVYLNADPKNQDTWKEENKLSITKDEDISFTFDKSYAGKAWPIACVKWPNDQGISEATGTQYYMAIPSLDKIQAGTVRAVKGTYNLTAKNDEKMFKVVKATLKDYAGDDDVLVFYLSGASYTWAFSGGQDAAVATFNNRETNALWVESGGKVTFPEEVSYGTYDGGTATASSGYEFTLPVTVSDSSFSVDVVAFSGGTKLGDVGQNFSARSFAIDTSSKALSLTASSASDSANVTVTSEVSDIPGGTGTVEYTGFTRPYAGGDQAAETYPLSNDWVGALTIDLGTSSIYDKAYVENFEGMPWLADGATAIEPEESDITSVGNDGKLALSIVNEYDTTPKTTQLDGNIVKVMMHIKADANVAKKDLWVERTFQLDFTSRTAATLEITGDSLNTPMVAPLADHGEDGDKDIAMEPEGYGLTIVDPQSSGNNFVVPFTGTGLKQHYNGQQTLGYWAGIAIPGITGKQIAIGAGTYNEDTQADFKYVGEGKDNVRKADGTYTQGGFDDIWFDLGKPETRDEAYVAVRDNDQDTTPDIYNLKFANMKLVYGITAAETENGAITVAEEATEGDIVKVTVTPDEGYKLAKLSYSLPGGQLADITDEAEFQMPSGDTTVSATFEPITYQVTFESNGGSAVAAQTVNHGAKAAKPADPTFKDYTFDGWYSDKNLKTAYDFSQAVTDDVTLYAKWNVNGNVMHRLYNPNSGEHFFTANEEEYKNVVAAGWNDEGVGWTAPATSGTPVYRLYNQYGGEHHYTTSKDERDYLVSIGWNDEEIGWYSDDAESVPLYRVYNPNAFANNHHYTTNEDERDYLVSIGWNDEKIGWYGLSE